MGGVVSNPEPPVPKGRRLSTESTTSRSAAVKGRRHSVGSATRHTSFKATDDQWANAIEKPSTARRPRVQTPRPLTPSVDDEDDDTPRNTKQICVLHFNDAYHIDASPAEPVGGVTRFMTAVRKYSHLNPLFFFGGDIFSPSIVSMVTKGKHMVGVLNTFGVQFSVVGNHDLDFGVDQFCKLAGECTGKWVCSNIWDADGKQLENTVPYCITENNGVKIGVLGVIEEEWLETLTIERSAIKYRDFIQVAREMATFLKMEHRCQAVIALTHMRYPNDEKLAASVPEVDLILGGHDHFYQVEQCSGTQIAKAGDDFHYLIAIQAEVDMAPVTKAANRPLKVLSLEQVPITSDLAEDPDMLVRARAALSASAPVLLCRTIVLVAAAGDAA
eukprot:TRINITY_DN9466_c0_g1_i2.p1 TRINITY_DN9466_c0_g1~~TRINITY_DN9466_c0_g1_i2.p1  ORF type:complete len:387 (-),score=135.66 TRINITY_DN9466_c0_g1_i2:117-1277(-)